MILDASIYRKVATRKLIDIIECNPTMSERELKSRLTTTLSLPILLSNYFVDEYYGKEFDISNYEKLATMYNVEGIRG